MKSLSVRRRLEYLLASSQGAGCVYALDFSLLPMAVESLNQFFCGRTQKVSLFDFWAWTNLVYFLLLPIMGWWDGERLTTDTAPGAQKRQARSLRLFVVAWPSFPTNILAEITTPLPRMPNFLRERPKHNDTWTWTSLLIVCIQTRLSAPLLYRSRALIVLQPNYLDIMQLSQENRKSRIRLKLGDYHIKCTIFVCEQKR